MPYKSNYFYLIASVFASGLSFGRNFLFMFYLNPSSVGQIAFMQTIIMLVGFIQIGLLSGGYRIYASGKPNKNKVNDVIIIYLGGLFLLAILLLLLFKSSWNYLDIEFDVALMGMIAGFFTLFSTWFSNTLIANQKLIMSSLINLSAALISFFLVFIFIKYDLYILLIAIAAQPLIILISALILNPNLRLRSLRFDLNIFKKIFALGIIPYLVGLFILSIYQVERWTILGQLGSENLGRYYLVIMYTSIITLIPASLMNLYYPRLIRAYEGQEKILFQSIFKRYLFELAIYLIMVILATLVFMPFFIEKFLPNYIEMFDLVLISLPGLIFLALRDVASLFFLTVNRLKHIFYAGIFMIFIYLSLVLILISIDSFTLHAAAYIRSSAFFAGFSLLFLQFFYVSRSSRYKWLTS